MCSFGACQTRFEFLSQFRKVRNAFECFVTQVQTHLPKTKRVRPMKINVICTVGAGTNLKVCVCGGRGVLGTGKKLEKEVLRNGAVKREGSSN